MSVWLIVDRNNPLWNYGYTERESEVDSLLSKARADARVRAAEWEKRIRESDARGVEYDREFFRKTYEGYRDADYQVMTQEDWIGLNTRRLLDDPLEEISEERFNEMLDVLPPLHWVSRNDVSEFCMSEMHWGSITTQCAHDRRTDRYWWKKVDSCDPSTWIDQILRKEGVEK